MSSSRRTASARPWAGAGKAAELAPQHPAYAYTLAFYLDQKGEKDEAVQTLEALLAKHPGDRDAESLLGELMKAEKKP